METTSSVIGVVGVILGSVGSYALMLAVTGMIIWHRTKSSHILLTRMWTFFYGKKECSVSPVAEFLNELTAIHQFRYFTGIRVRNLEQVANVTAVCGTDKEKLARIASAGHLYDLDAMRLRAERFPRWPTMICATVALSVGVWIVVGAFALLFVDRALLQMRASGTWFTLDATYAKPLTNAPGFRLSACSQPSLPASDVTGFAREDITAICQSFSAADTAKYVDSAIVAQRWALALGLTGLLYGLSLLYQWLTASSAALRLKRLPVLVEQEIAAGTSPPSANSVRQP